MRGSQGRPHLRSLFAHLTFANLVAQGASSGNSLPMSATLAFMASGFATVYVIRHLF